MKREERKKEGEEEKGKKRFWGFGLKTQKLPQLNAGI